MFCQSSQELGLCSVDDRLLPDRRWRSADGEVLNAGEEGSLCCSVEVRGKTEESSDFVSARGPEIECPLQQKTSLRVGNDEDLSVARLLVQLIDLVDDVLSL